MNVVICDAIRARRLLRFVYDGYERVVEPHLYGVNTTGREALSAWLVRGWSKSDPAPGWRLYLLGEMQDVAALAERFDSARPGYNAEDGRMVEVYCRLAVGDGT